MRTLLYLTLFGSVFSLYSASASVSLTFAAGVMRQANGDSVPIGSIGVLVADTANNGFGTDTSLVGSILTAGSALGGSDNLILQVFTASDIGLGIIGFNDNIIFNYSGSLNEGDSLNLYWFPTITTIGVTLQTGVSYGSYRTDLIDPASGSDIGFTAPSDTFIGNLGVFDNLTSPGALATPLNLTALSYTAIPEPSSIALLSAGGAFMIGAALRRRKMA